MTHDLKTWPAFFEAVVWGAKTFELRKNDRGFQKGDTLRLREFDATALTAQAGYTGRTLDVAVTYVLNGFGLQEGYVVLAISPLRSLVEGDYP